MKKKIKRNSVSLNKPTSFSSFFLQISIALIIVSLCIALGYVYQCMSSKTCTSFGIHNLLANQAVMKLPKGSILVDVVDTRESRELGLSGRESLGKDEGMLFVFDKPGKYGFWAKDMLFDFDLVWISEDGFVVDTERKVTPESYPKAYINKIDAQYVLEINADRAAELGIFIGTKVTIKGAKITVE